MRKIKTAILGLFALFAASCGCYGTNANTKVCVIERQVIDCTTDALKDWGPLVVTIVETFLSAGTSPDWSALEAKLEASGFTDGGCVLTQLENDLVTSPTLMASPNKASIVQGVSTALMTWKAHMGIPTVKYKIVGRDGKIVVR